MKRFVNVVPYYTHNAFGNNGRSVIKILLGRQTPKPWDAFGALHGADGSPKAFLAADAFSTATLGLAGSTNVLASKLRDKGIWVDVKGGTFILLKIDPPKTLLDSFELVMSTKIPGECPVDGLMWAELPHDDSFPDVPMSPLLTMHMPTLSKYLRQIEHDNGRHTWSDHFPLWTCWWLFLG